MRRQWRGRQAGVAGPQVAGPQHHNRQRRGDFASLSSWGHHSSRSRAVPLFPPLSSPPAEALYARPAIKLRPSRGVHSGALDVVVLAATQSRPVRRWHALGASSAQYGSRAHRRQRPPGAHACSRARWSSIGAAALQVTDATAVRAAASERIVAALREYRIDRARRRAHRDAAYSSLTAYPRARAGRGLRIDVWRVGSRVRRDTVRVYMSAVQFRTRGSFAFWVRYSRYCTHFRLFNLGTAHRMARMIAFGIAVYCRFEWNCRFVRWRANAPRL
jgi:hypothetical protein